MRSLKGLVIAAPQSGSGKTVLTRALIRLLVEDGHAVIPAKVGPDYIDPQFLSLAAGRPCLNLDGWAMRPESLAALLRSARGDRDGLLVVEGVMGLFDGSADQRGSTADLAALLGLPVVLVVDVRGQAGSVAALVRGFRDFRPNVRVVGTILNRVGSARHETMLRAALAEHCPEITVLGAIPVDEAWDVPERHLGLTQPENRVAARGRQQQGAALLRQRLDRVALEAIMDVPQLPPDQGAPLLPVGVGHLAVAYDAAFRFVYHGQLTLWQEAGVTVSRFSPLADEAPSPKAEAILLPGGYPELYLAELAGTQGFRAGMRAAADRGIPIHGECGGYMVLGESLEYADQTVPMLGLLSGRFRMSRRLTLGYRRVTLRSDHLFGRCGTRFTGHEFHYCQGEGSNQAAPLFDCVDALGAACPEAGVVRGHVSGSFVHLIDRA